MRDRGTGWRRKAAFCLTVTVRHVAVFAAAAELFWRARHSPKWALPKAQAQAYPTASVHGLVSSAAAAGQAIAQSFVSSRAATTPEVDDNMAKTLIGALALASQALAFSNTSPFFLFSTAEYARLPLSASPS